MDLNFSEQDRAFRDEVRQFLAERLPADIKRRVARGASYLPKQDHLTWMKILYDKGWIAPNWPVEYGGTGWTATRKHIFEAECAAADCPRVSPFGLSMVGPVIYSFGSQDQKDRFLPRILASEDWWCQGYSEPGAGSDLASLRTRAVREGDHYVVNGHKIWTSGAHNADWMFCLVRTNPDVKPQAGISFLLVDMKDPGITVKPIISMDRSHYLNEVFLDDVRVPVANRVGEQDKGWTYAKFLLGHERAGIAGVGKSRHRLDRLKDIARAELADGRPLLDDPAFRAKIAEVEVDLTGLDYTNLRNLARDDAGGGPGPESSILKIKGTEIEQAINGLLVEALGYYGAPHEMAMLQPDRNEPSIGPEHGVGLVPEQLLRRASSIYGGSNEIQKNIIAKMVLGL